MKHRFILFLLCILSFLPAVTLAQIKNLTPGMHAGGFTVQDAPPPGGPLVLLYEGQRYYPSAGTKKATILAIQQLNEHPDLLIATQEYGTALVRIQQETPIATFISQYESKCPNLGVLQKDNPDLLLFPTEQKAIVISTGEVLWFKALSFNSSADLVSISPDFKYAALLDDGAIFIVRLKSNHVEAILRLPPKLLRTLQSEEKSLKKQPKSTCNTTYTDKTQSIAQWKASWFSNNLRWYKKQAEWHLRTDQLDSAPLPIGTDWQPVIEKYFTALWKTGEIRSWPTFARPIKETAYPDDNDITSPIGIIMSENVSFQIAGLPISRVGYGRYEKYSWGPYFSTSQPMDKTLAQLEKFFSAKKISTTIHDSTLKRERFIVLKIQGNPLYLTVISVDADETRIEIGSYPSLFCNDCRQNENP